MQEFTATYSPDDNKLRLYASARLDADTYARVKAAGFKWAPKQSLFVAPMWTPEREALLIELAGEVGDEDTSLVDRAEERAIRFEEYSHKRGQDAERAAETVRQIADGIPLGQPILVGHHSEARARKDAKRIESGMQKAVANWRTAKYWTERASGALRHARYKETPSVRARRIARLEAELRKVQRTKDNADKMAALWVAPWDQLKRKDGGKGTPRQAVIWLANVDRYAPYYLDSYTHPSGYVGPINIWQAAGGNTDGKDPEEVAIATPEQICARAIEGHKATAARMQPWIDHYTFRIAYERAMLGQSGGTAADKTGPQKGGAVQCWATPGRYGENAWSYIQKVNKVSVTLLDNWGNGGRDFTRTIPFDKLTAVMSPEEVQAARDDGRLVPIDARGFYLKGKDPAPEPEPEPEATRETAPATDFAAMQATLAAGVQVVAAPQLFPTPRELAERVAELAAVEPGHEVLEPSAGTGALIGALGAAWHADGGRLVAVEVDGRLCERLRAEFPLTDVRRCDFLECNGDLGKFDRVVMNPPFANGADIRHILHARKFLKPGGRLVAICADGPRQQATLREAAEESGGVYEPLPEGTFASQGTNVRTALVVLEASEVQP